MFIRALTLAIMIAAAPLAAHAQEAEGPMTVPRMIEILTALDPDTARAGPGYQLTIENVPVLVIMDPVNNRMRAMVS
ncbi:MAG: hypothetical protein AAF762_12975, partial [Pseudomonadota bacterium]